MIMNFYILFPHFPCLGHSTRIITFNANPFSIFLVVVIILFISGTQTFCLTNHHSSVGQCVNTCQVFIWTDIKQMFYAMHYMKRDMKVDVSWIYPLLLASYFSHLSTIAKPIYIYFNEQLTSATSTIYLLLLLYYKRIHCS